MNDNVVCNRFINCLTYVTVTKHVVAHLAKSVTPLTIVELHNLINRLVVDAPHMGLVDQTQDGTFGNRAGRSNEKHPRKNEGGVTMSVAVLARNSMGTNTTMIRRTRTKAKARTRAKARASFATAGDLPSMPS
jgi:hypothetical protein